MSLTSLTGSFQICASKIRAAGGEISRHFPAWTVAPTQARDDCLGLARCKSKPAGRCFHVAAIKESVKKWAWSSHWPPRRDWDQVSIDVTCVFQWFGWFPSAKMAAAPEGLAITHDRKWQVDILMSLQIYLKPPLGTGWLLLVSTLVWLAGQALVPPPPSSCFT